MSGSLIPTAFVQGFCDDLKYAASSALDDARLLGTVDSTVLSVFLEELTDKIQHLEHKLQTTTDDTTTLISAELVAARHVVEDRTEENTYLREALNAEEVRIREMLWRLGSRDRMISELKAHVIRQSTHGLSGMSASFAALPFQMMESLDAEVHHVQEQASQRVASSQTANHVTLQKQRAAYEERLNAKERELIQAQMRYRDSLRSLEATHAIELWRAQEEKRELQGLLTDVDQHATQRAEAFCAEKYDERYSEARREFVVTMDKLKHEVDRLHEERGGLSKTIADVTKERETALQQSAYSQAALQHVLDVEVPALKAQLLKTRGDGAGQGGTAGGASSTAANKEEHAALVSRALSLETDLSVATETFHNAKQQWEQESLSLQNQLKIARHEAQTKDSGMREAQAAKSQLNSQLQNALKTELQLQAEVDFLRRSAGAASAESFKKMLEQAEADHDFRMVELTDEVNTLREKLNATLDDKVELTERLRVSEASYRACDAERSDFRSRSNKLELRMAEMKQQYDSVQDRLVEVQKTLGQERNMNEKLMQQIQNLGTATPSSATSRLAAGGGGGGLQRSRSMRQSTVNVLPGDGALAANSNATVPSNTTATNSAALRRVGSTVKRVGSMFGAMGRTKSFNSAGDVTASLSPRPNSEVSTASSSGGNLLGTAQSSAAGVTFTVGGPRKARGPMPGGPTPLPFDDIEVVPGSPDRPLSATTNASKPSYEQNALESSLIADPANQWSAIAGAGGLALPQLAIQRVSVQLDENHTGFMGASFLSPMADASQGEGPRQLTMSQNLAVANFVFPMSPHNSGAAPPGALMFAGSLRGDGSLPMTPMNGPTAAHFHRFSAEGGGITMTTDVPVALTRSTALGEHNSATSRNVSSFSSSPAIDGALPPLTLLRVASIHSHDGRQQLVLMPHHAAPHTSVGTQCDDINVPSQQRAPTMYHGATIPISVDDRRTHAQLRHELTVLHREVCFLEHQLSSLHDQHPVLQRSHSRPSGAVGQGNTSQDDVPLWKRAGLQCQANPLELQPIPALMLNCATNSRCFTARFVSWSTSSAPCTINTPFSSGPTVDQAVLLGKETHPKTTCRCGSVLVCSAKPIPLELQPIPFTDITHRKEFLEENMRMAEELDARHGIFLQLRDILAHDLDVLHNLGASVVPPSTESRVTLDPKVEAPIQKRGASPLGRPTNSSTSSNSGQVVVFPVKNSMPPGNDLLVARFPVKNSMPPGNDLLVARHSTSPTLGENQRTSPVRVKLQLSTAALQPVIHPVTPRSCGGAYPHAVPQKPHNPKRPSSSARPTSAATSRRTWTSSSADGLSGGNTTPSSLMQDLRTSISAVLEPADYFSVGYRTEESRRPQSARTVGGATGGMLSRAPVWSSANMGVAAVGGGTVGNSHNVPTVRVVSSSTPAAAPPSGASSRSNDRTQRLRAVV
ncbi:Hypothetical protein, putative [Bodo saltans]|uniref:Uncharacterized protein n=1 Tax=Bodo saltans TaxID=75058 RepID=A0A0S4JPX8_BODSA|nr:Hypothetical protein, putative [Bodo saltans]|eukprot:CUG92747.1 Hypothetical protein, putative [Bodo saltans]